MTRETWSSSLGFILASIGSAVGLGNIWRFPYIVGTNGGGAFLIPYLIALLLFGMPIMILEFALGRHYNTSLVPALMAIRGKFKIMGLFIVGIMGMILSYYLVITGWVLAYFLFFVAKDPVSFSGFTDSYDPLLFFIVCGGIIFFVVRAGIIRGIEKICRVLMPLLFGLLLLLLTFALTLPGAMQGIDFYITPDFSKLTDPLVWRAAFGQAFFSLGVGMGILLTYGSYMKDEKIMNSAAIITISDLLIALLIGFVIFPFVFSFGLDPGTGVQLAFVTLPTIFQEMSYGLFLGAVFFLLLFFAALTSAVSILEVPVATLIDSYGFTRKRATLVVTLIVVLVGMPSALSYTPLKLELDGEPVLDLLDVLFGNIGIVVAGLILTIIAGWFVYKGIIFREIGGHRQFQRVFITNIKFFVPVILFINLAFIVFDFI